MDLTKHKRDAYVSLKKSARGAPRREAMTSTTLGTAHSKRPGRRAPQACLEEAKAQALRFVRLMAVRRGGERLHKLVIIISKFFNQN